MKEKAANTGSLSSKAVFINGTHIKAGTNTKKQVKEVIPVTSQRYARPKKRRDNTSRKKPARRKREKTRTVTKSVTDPDSGLFVKGSYDRQFTYEATPPADANGFVPEAVVTLGNVHDGSV